MRAIIVHGGAWDIPAELHEDHVMGCSKALDLGMDRLKHGHGSLDAVEVAVMSMEEDCTFDAGCGSFLNQVGEVEMDAMIMEGRYLRFGSVAAIRNVRHPIHIARKVMQDTKHCMLVGDGAMRFARSIGAEIVPSHELVSPRELERWQTLRSQGDYDQISAFEPNAKRPMGTVGAVAIDDEGDISVATSTGGTPNKMQGRVGDSPLVGCGTYADNETAGVSATGFGESLMKICIARKVCEEVGRDRSASEAARLSIEHLARRVDGRGGVIILDSKGDLSWAFNTPMMAEGHIDRDGRKSVAVRYLTG
jgi:beta-aspartyl-peptidase (threonine type)